MELKSAPHMFVFYYQ